MSNGEHGPISAEQVPAIAARFAAVLAEWLTPAEFAEMKRLNATPEYASGICASQDYCDANMAMDQAIRDVTGRGPFPYPGDENTRDEDCSEAQIEADVAIWNAAWDLARKQGLIEAKQEVAA